MRSLAVEAGYIAAGRGWDSRKILRVASVVALVVQQSRRTHPSLSRRVIAK